MNINEVIDFKHLVLHDDKISPNINMWVVAIIILMEELDPIFQLLVTCESIDSNIA